MTKYLILFSIGPVQSFISRARKTRDLYAASRLLSDLCLEAMEDFTETGGTVIYPKIDPNDKNPSIPNRFIGSIETTDTDKLYQKAELIKSKIQTSFISKAQAVFIQEKLGFNADVKTQIENYLEVFWVAVPMTDDYAKDYETLNKALGSIKHERSIKQIAEQGRKCSIDGEWNDVVYQKPKPSFIIDEQKKSVQEFKRKNNALQPSEALSAISFLKRFYQKDSFAAEFHSTAGIATLDTVQYLKSSENFKDYKKLLDNDFDEQLLYESNLNPQYFEKQGIIKNLEGVRKVYKKLKTDCKDNNLRIEEYYAVLVFDGDEAGQWISGKFMDKIDQPFHENISGLLAKYAQSIRIYFNKNPQIGQVVYAGGDDFMGFINLSHLFQTLQYLRTQFKKLVDDELSKIYAGKYKPSYKEFTFSAGLIIAHYREPLGQVLSIARELEHTAKKYPNKNAISMAVARHSQHSEGGVFTLPWNFGNPKQKKQNSLETLLGILKLLSPKSLKAHAEFSNTFINNLHHRMYEFYDDPDTEDSFYVLLEKYLGRSFTGKSDKTTSVELMKKLLSDLREMVNNDPKVFMNVLDTLDFLSNHVNPTTIHATANN